VYVKSGDGGQGLPRLGGIGGDGKYFFKLSYKKMIKILTKSSIKKALQLSIKMKTLIFPCFA
jgi:hypothetical protein